MNNLEKLSFPGLLVATALIGSPGCTTGDDSRPALDRLPARVTESAPAAAAGPSVASLESGAARVGVLWGTYLDPFDDERPYRYELVVHELPIGGSFPDDFTIELTEPPPAELADRHPTGVMVLLREDADFGLVIPGSSRGAPPSPHGSIA